MLDVFDKFVNYFGIVAVAFVSLIVIVANEKLGLLGNHLKSKLFIQSRFPMAFMHCNHHGYSCLYVIE